MYPKELQESLNGAVKIFSLEAEHKVKFQTCLDEIKKPRAMK